MVDAGGNIMLEKWLNSPNVPETMKQQLITMSDAEKSDAFYTNIAFGTAGMRGILGPGTNRINIFTIRKANEGFGQYILEKGGASRGIAIGYDNRHQSKEFAFDSARYLASLNIKTYVFENLRPTPELSFAVRYYNCFGGIMITASHNPKEYNGYKLYDETGCQLIPELASQVIEKVNAVEDLLSLSYELTPEQEKLITVIGKEVDEAYYQEVLHIAYEPHGVEKPIKIVFSNEHGTAYIPVNTILNRAGYRVYNVLEQTQFDPDFTYTKSPNPEEKEAYDLALTYAKQYQAHLVLVCDPDADRMGVAVYHQGEYVLLTGNQTGALLMHYICHRLKTKDAMPHHPVMCNTIVTGDLSEKIAGHYGVATEKTLTGFKFIGEKIANYEKTKEKHYIFGFEESYGSLISPFVRDKDAPQACLMLAEACAYYHASQQTLVDVLNDLYAQYGYYAESQVSITLKGQEGAQKIQAILKTLRTQRPESIAQVKVVKVEDYLSLQQEDVLSGQMSPLVGFVASNVLKFYLEDGSWIAIRPSGTEPKCKIYFCVKGETEASAQSSLKQYEKEMLAYTK